VVLEDMPTIHTPIFHFIPPSQGGQPDTGHPPKGGVCPSGQFRHCPDKLSGLM
jgi:hypothetical protein